MTTVILLLKKLSTVIISFKISFFSRFELREDRKREVVRTTGHMDSLRRDLHDTFSRLSPVPPTVPPNGLSPNHIYQTTFCGRTLSGGRSLLIPPQLDGRGSLNTSQEDGGEVAKSVTLTSLDLDSLKAEILAGVKHEIREALQQSILHNLKYSNQTTPSSQHRFRPQSEPGSLPLSPYNLDLYHTHLYTQL